MPTPFRVLAVCTGNICRSPAVERLLAIGLGAAYRGAPVGALAPAIEVGSAGVGAVVGAPMTAPMAELVAGVGGVTAGFAARQLTEAHVREADLVIALTRRHRAAVVELVPSAVRRTFTLRELGRLATLVDPAALPGAGATTADRLAALVPLAGAARPSAGPVSAGDDDVVDPYRGDDVLYQRSFGQLFPAVQAIVGVVRR
jgi:protein-tyrosine phosphatase